MDFQPSKTSERFRRRGRYLVPPRLDPKAGTRSLATLPEGVDEATAFLAQEIRERFILPAVSDSASPAALDEFLHEEFDSFFETLFALQVLLSRALSEDRALRLAANTFTIDADFADALMHLGGEELRGEFEFADATLRRAVRLVNQVGREEPPEGARANDAELAARFQYSVALFHFGGLGIAAIASGDATPRPSLVDHLVEYLRCGALDAYAAVREAIELRRTTDEAMSGALDLMDEATEAVALADEDVLDAAAIADTVESEP